MSSLLACNQGGQSEAFGPPMSDTFANTGGEIDLALLQDMEINREHATTSRHMGAVERCEVKRDLRTARDVLERMRA